MTTIIRADYAVQAPQLELITNPELIWQLKTNWRLLPLVHVWQAALMLKAAERIDVMHADYIANGPVADYQRWLS